MNEKKRLEEGKKMSLGFHKNYTGERGVGGTVERQVKGLYSGRQQRASKTRPGLPLSQVCWPR